MTVKQIVARLLESGNMRWKKLVTDQDFSDESQFMLFLLSPHELKWFTQTHAHQKNPRAMYSLRDSEDVPYVTALFDPVKKELQSVVGPENAGYSEEAVPYIEQLAKELGATTIDFSKRGRPVAKRKYSSVLHKISGSFDDETVGTSTHEYAARPNFASKDQVQKEIDRLLDVYSKASDQEKPAIERQIKELSAKTESKARQVVNALLHEQDNVDDPQSFVNSFRSPPGSGLPPLQQHIFALDVALTGKTLKEVVSQYHHYPATVEEWILQPGGNPMWQLSDMGYSAIVWNYEDHVLFLTSNSRQQVKDRWEAAMPQRQALLNYLVSEWNRIGQGL